MTDTDRSNDQSLLSRAESLLSWPDADKVLLTSFIFFCFEAGLLLGHFVMLNSEADFLSADFAVLDLKVRTGFVATWLAIFAFALWRRRRSGPDPLLVRAFFSTVVVIIVYNSWASGTYSQTYVCAAALGSLSIGALLFKLRVVATAVTLGVVAFVVIAVLQQAHVIPYAPLLTSAPYSDGFMSAVWLLNHELVGISILVFAGFSTLFVTHLWRDREQQLARANELISRYVASQVASEIRAGHFDVVDRASRPKLTMFFSDIKGFSAIADLVEPEELAEELNEYLGEMTLIANKYDATIDKFVGDAIMIFFGAPKSSGHQQNALRAVRMAMEMQSRMIELAEHWVAKGFGDPFEIRIGINTGHASLGNFGSPERLDYTVIGRQVNLAARLESRCKPGKILISHSTWMFVKDEILCDPLGEISVKGIREPVSVYEVVGTRASAAANP